MKCKYNFTDGFNKGVKDKAPDWINDFLKKEIKKKEVVKINDIYNLNKTEIEK